MENFKILARSQHDPCHVISWLILGKNFDLGLSRHMLSPGPTYLFIIQLVIIPYIPFFHVKKVGIQPVTRWLGYS